MYENEHNDIITLRYTLLQCRKQLLISIKNLFDTEIAYSKIELREDFDRLKVSYDTQKNETDLLRNDFHQLIENCKLLVEQTTGILSERDLYYSQWQYAKNILTPRPDWDKCTDLIPDWRIRSIGKSSQGLVDLIINEIVQENPDEYLSMSKTEFSETNTFFERASTTENILPKNRHIRRRMIGLLIKDIWSNKLSLGIQLTDYVFDYLIKRFDSHSTAIEMSYNIRDACHRYRNHYEINLFWQILTGQMEENVYHYEMKEFARILQYLIKFEDLKFTLDELYPHWNRERIKRVLMSAERELQQKNSLDFLMLFIEDDEGHIGEFLRNIREELHVDKEEYIEKIKNILIDQPLISIKQFKQAIKLIDPLISKPELHRYINWVFEFNKTQRDLEEIIYRLEHCSCFMH